MPTDIEIKRIYNELLDSMALAGWLKNYTVTDGKGYHLTWTEVGASKLTFLKLIAEKLSLDEDDDATFSLDSIVHNGALPNEKKSLNLNPDIASAWRDCVSELKVQGDKDKLYVMIQIAINLAPNRKE